MTPMRITQLEKENHCKENHCIVKYQRNSKKNLARKNEYMINV